MLNPSAEIFQFIYSILQFQDFCFGTLVISISLAAIHAFLLTSASSFMVAGLNFYQVNHISIIRVGFLES